MKKLMMLTVLAVSLAARADVKYNVVKGDGANDKITDPGAWEGGVISADHDYVLKDGYLNCKGGTFAGNSLTVGFLQLYSENLMMEFQNEGLICANGSYLRSRVGGSGHSIVTLTGGGLKVPSGAVASMCSSKKSPAGWELNVNMPLSGEGVFTIIRDSEANNGYNYLKVNADASGYTGTIRVKGAISNAVFFGDCAFAGKAVVEEIGGVGQIGENAYAREVVLNKPEGWISLKTNGVFTIDKLTMAGGRIDYEGCATGEGLRQAGYVKIGTSFSSSAPVAIHCRRLALQGSLAASGTTPQRVKLLADPGVLSVEDFSLAVEDALATDDYRLAVGTDDGLNALFVESVRGAGTTVTNVVFGDMPNHADKITSPEAWAGGVLDEDTNYELVKGYLNCVSATFGGRSLRIANSAWLMLNSNEVVAEFPRDGLICGEGAYLRHRVSSAAFGTDTLKGSGLTVENGASVQIGNTKVAPYGFALNLEMPLRGGSASRLRLIREDANKTGFSHLNVRGDASGFKGEIVVEDSVSNAVFFGDCGFAGRVIVKAQGGVGQIGTNAYANCVTLESSAGWISLTTGGVFRVGSLTMAGGVVRYARCEGERFLQDGGSLEVDGAFAMTAPVTLRCSRRGLSRLARANNGLVRLLSAPGSLSVSDFALELYEQNGSTCASTPEGYGLRVVESEGRSVVYAEAPTPGLTVIFR